MDAKFAESTDNFEERLLDLILDWEKSVAEGRHVTPTEICKDCPEMADEFLRALTRLNRFDQFLFPDQVTLPDTLAGETIWTSEHLPKLPGYEFLAEIGRGGMGIVYKARQVSLNRIVAVKTLRTSFDEPAAFLARLRQEAKGLSRLDHANVVKVYDVVESPGTVSIILEYVEGESLSHRLKRAVIPPHEAAVKALQLARALAFVHRHGLLHRDIKPANVLIALDGTIKLADFGLVKEQESQEGLTETGDFLGTPSYMAPEQSDGRAYSVDVRTDVYAAGATLYEMLSGRPPFAGSSKLDTLIQVLNRDVVPLRILNPDIPRDLETICLKCLEKTPSQRFSSAEELAEELERFKNGLPIQSRPIGLVERCRRWCRRRPAVASLLAFAAIAASLVVVLLISMNRNLRDYNFELTRLNDDSKRLNNELSRANEELDRAASNARELQRVAEEHERQARDALYISDINRAAIALRQGDTREATALLDRNVPKPGEPDRRGFEWWSLRRQTYRASTVLLETGAGQYFLSYSIDRKRLAVAGADAIVRLLDAQSGELKMEIATGQIEVNGLAFSPDGKELASAGDDGTICIWSLESGTQRLKFAAHPSKVFQLVYVCDGQQIISCGDDPIIRVFDAKTGDLLGMLDGHQHQDVQSVIKSEDGKTLFSMGNDHAIRIWNLGDRTEIGSFELPADVLTAVFLQDRGLLIAGDASGELRTIDVRNQTVVSSAKHLDKIAALAIHPNGTLLAVGDNSGQIRLKTLNPAGDFIDDPNQLWHGHTGSVNSIVWTTDGNGFISTGADGRILSWNLAAGQTAEPKEEMFAMASGFSLIRNSNSLLIRSSSNRLVRWDWNDSREIAECSNEFLNHASVSPNETLLAALLFRTSEDQDDEIRLFDNRIDRNLGTNLIASWAPHRGQLRNVRFSPDSKWMSVVKSYRDEAKGINESNVWLVDVPPVNFYSNKPIQVATELNRVEQIPVLSSKDSLFSPDNRRLLITTGSGLVQWDLLKQCVDWTISDSRILHAAYHPDSSLIATAGSDRLVHLISADDGSTRFRLPTHRASVLWVSFSPDGRLLATSSRDGAVKIWHVESGQELLEFSDPGQEARQIEFTTDGNHLICQFGPKGEGFANKFLIFNGSAIER